MKLDPSRLYCVYAHVEASGETHIFAGKISTAFVPKYEIYGTSPVDVEIMETHPTYELARAAVPRPPTPAHSASAGRSVRCVEDGREFPSANAAAAAVGVAASNMSTHLAHGTPRSLRGLHFERFDGAVAGSRVTLADVLPRAEQILTGLKENPDDADLLAELREMEKTIGTRFARPDGPPVSVRR